MAFLLTAELDAEKRPHEAYRRYQAYLTSVRDTMPPGAYALATSDWYFNSEDHRAPHDAWLEALSIGEASLDASQPADQHRGVTITIRLLGAYHDAHLEFSYRDVSRYRLDFATPHHPRHPGHRDWRYDEFRLAPGGRVEHEIEWWGSRPTGTWLIEAADVEHRYLPLPEASRASSSSRGSSISNPTSNER